MSTYFNTTNAPTVEKYGMNIRVGFIGQFKINISTGTSITLGTFTGYPGPGTSVYAFSSSNKIYNLSVITGTVILLAIENIPSGDWVDTSFVGLLDP